MAYFGTSWQVVLLASVAGAVASFPVSLMVATSIFQVNVMEATESRIALSATTDYAIDAQDVLQILRLAYDHLKPRNAPAAAGG